jgi:hypothetical protein
LPTNTYTPLATVTLGGTDSDITFSSIPSTYRDLVLVVNGKTTAGVALYARFNSDSTSANYPRVGIAGYGSTAASFSGTEPGIQAAFLTTANTWILNVMDYSATDKQKTVLSRLSQDTSEVNAIATRWANTAAITSVQFITASSTFAAGTTFSLYGVIA